MRRCAAFVVLSLAAFACSKERPAPGASAGSASATSSAQSAASARSPGAPSLEEGAIRKLIDAWIAAQNDGDFAAYERLYAPRFTGVKRAGNRETTFDREGWLADRKSMFARPMRVSAEKLKLNVSPAGASAELEQTWSSATYRDVGVKRMVIVPAPQGPRIAREEMLSSAVAGPEARVGMRDLMVVHRDGVILSARPDAAWASGPSRLEAGRRVVVRDVDEAKLPAEIRERKGRAVRAFAADGRSCTAKITGFALRAEVVPHFGMEQHWRGELGEPAATPPQIAEQLWELAENGGRALVGKLESGCTGAWALAEDKAPPAVAVPAAQSPELRDAAVKAFRSLRSYRQIQKEFDSEGSSTDVLWDAARPDTLQVSVFEAAGKPVLVSVSAQAGLGCGEFYGSLSALFAVRGAEKHELTILDEPSALEPIAAFDLDGDGAFEVLFAPERGSDERSLWRREIKGGSIADLFAIPNFDCPC